MKKVIPQYTEVTCDFCKVRIDSRNGRTNSVLKFYRDGLSMMGEPCVAVKDDFDLCDDCSRLTENFIQSFGNKLSS